MPSEQGCAVAIVDGKALEGTLSKDDLILRVVAQGRDPRTTIVGEVMTPPLTTVSPDSEAEDALKPTFEKHQCYLPIVDSRGESQGLVGNHQEPSLMAENCSRPKNASVCQLFKENRGDLVGQLASLEAYIAGRWAGQRLSAPELMRKGSVSILVEQCKGCGFCVEFCPTKVLALSSAFNSKGYHPPHVIAPERCSGCDLCGMYCPDFAIFGWKSPPAQEDSADAS